MAALESLNCIDIVRPYIEAVTTEGMPSVQLLGGVGSVALLNEATVIKPEERRVIAPANLRLSQYRNDGNLRDVETLVLSSDETHAEQVEVCARQAIGDNLIVEVFGFKDIARADELIAHPFGPKALMAFLSDRYMQTGSAWSADGPAPQRILFPFSTPIAAEALETWTLEIDDSLEIPIPSPGAVIVNYLTRSISGLRAKDSAKVQEMCNAVFEKAPETVEWIVDGPGRNQFKMARIFHTLREPKNSSQSITVGERLSLYALPTHKLRDNAFFMLADADEATQARAIKLAVMKSRGLHAAESMTFVVTFFQKYIEPRIGSIIHND